VKCQETSIELAQLMVMMIPVVDGLSVLNFFFNNVVVESGILSGQ
jgi:hypothetical protein